MISDYTNPQPEDGDQAVAPDYEREFFNAKLFLQKASTESGDNLYDHLSEVLNRILAERPENVIDFFEEFSRRIKENRYRPLDDHLRDVYVDPARLGLAKKMLEMFKPSGPGEPSTENPEDRELAEMSSNNLLELLFYLEQCGLGLPRPEMYFIMLSIRDLIHSEPIASIRFWGKIYGTTRNYLVLECDLKGDEYVKRNEEYQKELELKEKATVETPEASNFLAGEENEIERALRYIGREQTFFFEDSKYPRKLPPYPQVEYERPPEPPSEQPGVGINKKVYYVCNDVGEQWIQLPDVNPQQIRVARQIYRAFTGNLEHPVHVYPEFPGVEKHLLRAQIARISAGTQIAPLGYYTFGKGDMGEGAEEDENEPEEVPDMSDRKVYRVNPKYEPPQLKDLLDPSMSFWVHHVSHILPQGRTTWWNPNPVPDVQDEEMEEELGEEEEEDTKRKATGARIEPETGPPLLNPVSEDASLEATPPWGVRSVGLAVDKFSIAVVRSNLWPGAHCFSTQGKLFQNVYMGSGLKYMVQNFSPAPLPPVQQDYPIGPEIMEIMDPTGAEEERWRIDHLPKPKPIQEIVGEEDEEEGDEEEDEEEEDED